ncbi:MAG: NTP transferase domain-containing protein [Candidatus Eremiobacteraeota bacterium]|nr:NTP transferase domain-containing protein [Candidatus Eremiobacteraeota bacterium]
MNVVVLAGGPPDELAAHTSGAPNKAYVKIAGKTLLQRTIEPLRAARSVSRIIVVTPPEAFSHSAALLADERRPDGKRIRDSLQSGLAQLAGNDNVLIATSDLPVLTSEAVDDFIARVHQRDADLSYGCLEKSVHMAAYPEVPHTWVRLKDGTYCGGGLMAMKPRVFPSLSRFIEQLGQARKNPLRLASLFGWDILLRFAIRRVAVADAEERASKILGAPTRAIISPYAESAVNVDRVSDIALAEKLISSV